MRQSVGFRLLVVVALASLVLVVPLAAQERQSFLSLWSNLDGLRAGDRVELKTRDKKTHSGNFVACSEEAISLRERAREVGYRREDVVQVRLVIRGEPGKAALKGFLIGLVAAGLTTPFVAFSCGDYVDTVGGDFGTCMARQTAFSVGIFGGIGAGLYAAVARPTKILLYRAPAGDAAGKADDEGLRRPEGLPASSSPLRGPAPGALPAPLRDAYRVFSTEQAAHQLAQELLRQARASEGAAAGKERLQ